MNMASSPAKAATHPSALHLVIHGRVQGMGYRAWAMDTARQLGLTGWVRNNNDSTVEMVVCGPSAAVAAMHQQCDRGPTEAHVLRIDASVWDGDVPEDFRQLETQAAA